MAKLSAESFLVLLRRSGLAETAAVDNFVEQLRAGHDGRLPPDAQSLARELIRGGVITRAQFDQVVQEALARRAAAGKQSSTDKQQPKKPSPSAKGAAASAVPEAIPLSPQEQPPQPARPAPQRPATAAALPVGTVAAGAIPRGVSVASTSGAMPVTRGGRGRRRNNSAATMVLCGAVGVAVLLGAVVWTTGMLSGEGAPTRVASGDDNPAGPDGLPQVDSASKTSDEQRPGDAVRVDSTDPGPTDPPDAQPASESNAADEVEKTANSAQPSNREPGPRSPQDPVDNAIGIVAPPEENEPAYDPGLNFNPHEKVDPKTGRRPERGVEQISPLFAQLEARFALPQLDGSTIGTELTLGSLDLPEGRKLSMRLIGGEAVLGRGRSFTMLEESAESTQGENAQETAFRVELVSGEDSAQRIARFSLTSGELTFDWLQDAAPGPADQLRNCLVELAVETEKRVFPLRSEIVVDPLVVGLEATGAARRGPQQETDVLAMPEAGLIKLEIVKLGGRFPPVLIDPSNVVPLDGFTTLHLKSPGVADAAPGGRPATEPISFRVMFQANGRKGLRFHVVPYYTDGRGKSSPLVIDRLVQDVKNVEAAIAATNAQLEFLEKNKDQFNRQRELFEQKKTGLGKQVEQLSAQLEQANRLVTQYNDLKGAAQIHFRVVVDLGEGNRLQLIRGGELVRNRDVRFENLERKEPGAGD